MSAPVRAILHFERTVADLARSEAYYGDGLGFVRTGPPEPLPPAIRDAYGTPDATAIRLTLELGVQRLDLVAFDPPGAPYPHAPLATDPVFQHLAIPVRDMDAAYARLGGVGFAAISLGGPQTLPPSSGGVVAYKFRDPDGHPLELIHFPDGPAAERWSAAPGLFLGIDHSAITVTDREAALTFYRDALGLRLAQHGLNRGAAQGRLDGVPDPVVDVIALEPADAANPHMELLHYRQPATARPSPAPYSPRDRATTRFVVAVADLATAVTAIRTSGCPVRVAAAGGIAYAEGPDGHGLLLVQDGTGA